MQKEKTRSSTESLNACDLTTTKKTAKPKGKKLCDDCDMNENAFDVIRLNETTKSPDC